MRIARIVSPEGPSHVVLDGDTALEVGADVRPTGRSWPLADVRLLAPVEPSKIVCIGKNYADHVQEFGGEIPADPIMFLKPPSSIVGPGDDVVLPPDAERVDFEGELAVVIGTRCRHVAAADAASVILGYTVANDVTSRDQQRADGQWTRGKGHDTFCPIGPWIETDIDASDLRLRTELDGAVRQDTTTALLLHGVPALVEWVTRVMTLVPGDVILTGTPAGVAAMSPGQTVSVTVDGIGTLTNPVVTA